MSKEIISKNVTTLGEGEIPPKTALIRYEIPCECGYTRSKNPNKYEVAKILISAIGTLPEIHIDAFQCIECKIISLTKEKEYLKRIFDLNAVEVNMTQAELKLFLKAFVHFTATTVRKKGRIPMEELIEEYIEFIRARGLRSTPSPDRIYKEENGS